VTWPPWEFNARGRVVLDVRATTSMCRVGVKRSCATRPYRGRWANVKGVELHNCACGAQMLVVARNLAMLQLRGGACWMIRLLFRANSRRTRSVVATSA
jgi:hypothetical protein